MNKLKVIFTDSGLGGLSVMADFARLTRNSGIEIIFFNAHYSREKGYKSMSFTEQVEVFEKALAAMQKKYKADYIAIACNTLSVVFQNSKYKKESSAKIYDIVATGRKLIKESAYDTVVELAMPTTIQSQVYRLPGKTTIGIGTDVRLPDAIESMNKLLIKNILKKTYSEVKNKLTEQNILNNKLALFLGCTHFPLIKKDFFETAEELGIFFSEILNPNIEFASLIFDEIRKTSGKKNNTEENLIKIVSRVKLKESEIQNISNLVSIHSPETAEALKNYQYIPDLF